jgi:hypothetical protein
VGFIGSRSKSKSRRPPGRCARAFLKPPRPPKLRLQAPRPTDGEGFAKGLSFAFVAARRFATWRRTKLVLWRSERKSDQTGGTGSAGFLQTVVLLWGGRRRPRPGACVRLGRALLCLALSGRSVLGLAPGWGRAHWGRRPAVARNDNHVGALRCQRCVVAAEYLFRGLSSLRPDLVVNALAQPVALNPDGPFQGIINPQL